MRACLIIALLSVAMCQPVQAENKITNGFKKVVHKAWRTTRNTVKNLVPNTSLPYTDTADAYQQGQTDAIYAQSQGWGYTP